MRTRRLPRLPGHNDWLGCLCWCGDQVVQVTISDVRKGRTLSCGKDGCDG